MAKRGKSSIEKKSSIKKDVNKNSPERYTTGVPGVDTLLNGGIINHSAVLLTGAPGTGKTIFTLQYLIEGAKKGQPGLMITPELSAEEIRMHAKSLGLDLEKYEKKGLINFCEDSLASGSRSPLKVPFDIIKKKKIQRLVLDTITFFKYIFIDEKEFRKGLLSFIREMKLNNITFLATSERSTCDVYNFRFQDQDFLFDGLISLSITRKGASFERTLNIVKMRGQEHDSNIYPISIGKGGITVRLKQLPFSLIEKSEK
ncbi:MAG: ATPase domain-containing protein [archaeon]|nr:hypothetical protein [Nanoarchaeota archaeon]